MTFWHLKKTTKKLITSLDRELKKLDAKSHHGPVKRLCIKCRKNEIRDGNETRVCLECAVKCGQDLLNTKEKK